MVAPGAFRRPSRVGTGSDSMRLIRNFMPATSPRESGYVVYSKATKDEEGRTCGRGDLMIGISPPGKIEECCTPENIWRVQDRNDPAVPASPGVKAFHYPSAVEHERRLFVIYTVGDTPLRQCELAIIPIASLQLKNR